MGALAGCDAGPYHDQSTVGPPIHLVANGTNIEPAHGYTIDQPIRLAFDRFLDPRTVTRQSVMLEDSGGNLVTDPLIAYDPVTLTVTISNPGASLGWLKGGEQYRVVLGVPNYEGGGPSGLQAIDGATLSAPVTILFTAGAAAEPPFNGIPQMQFCRDVLTPVFSYSCAYGGCHGTPPSNAAAPYDAGEAPLGLDLSSQRATRATAVGQVADESNTGPSAKSASWALGTPFGVDMPIIDPTAPGNSWLVYKTLLAIPAAADAAADNAPDAGFSSYGAGMTSPVSAAERQRLSNFILGNSMPYPSPAAAEPSTSTLSQADLIRLSAWIAQGAPSDPACP